MHVAVFRSTIIRLLHAGVRPPGVSQLRLQLQRRKEMEVVPFVMFQCLIACGHLPRNEEDAWYTVQPIVCIRTIYTGESAIYRLVIVQAKWPRLNIQLKRTNILLLDWRIKSLWSNPNISNVDSAWIFIEINSCFILE